MSSYIPIYAQYYDENNTVVTKEISYKDYPTSEPKEIGIHVTVDDNNSSIKIKYVNSKIKMAANMARLWAEANNIQVFFSSFIFTIGAPKEWWTYPLKEPTYNNYYYESHALSRSKEKGLGVIIRASNLPWIDNTSSKTAFTCQLIPF
jgi:hypothetical protein